MTISVRRRRATSSHAPRNGPLSAAGSTAAAEVIPASGALPVRSSTSSTPLTANIEEQVRDSDTVSTKPGYRGRRSSLTTSRFA